MKKKSAAKLSSKQRQETLTLTVTLTLTLPLTLTLTLQPYFITFRNYSAAFLAWASPSPSP